MHYVLTVDEWYQEEGNIRPNPSANPAIVGTPPPAPTVFTVITGLMDDGPHRAATAGNLLHLAIRQFLRELRLEIYAAIGEVILKRFQDEGIPVESIQVLQIVNQLFEWYGTPSLADINELKGMTKQPLIEETASAFIYQTSEMMDAFQHLNRSRQTVNELDKIAHLVTACQHFPYVIKAIQDFRDLNFDIDNQTFLGCRIFCINRLNNKPTDTLSGIGFSSASGVSIAHATQGPPQYNQGRGRQHQGRGAPYGHGGQGRGGRGQGRGSHQGRRQSQGIQGAYCYKHGHNTHLGIDCSIMQLGSDGHTYSYAQRIARSPTDVPAGVAHGNPN